VSATPRPSVARELLDALSGPYPFAAAHEFQQRGPQVMRDLLDAHDDLLAALKALDAYFVDDNPGGVAADGWLAKLHADAQAAVRKAEASEP